MKTMADGIAVGLPGDVPFAAVRDHVDEIVTVSEESLSRALLALVERAKQVVEPAGAAAVAALLDSPTRGPRPRSPSSPAATSTPSCSARSSATAWPPPAATSTCT